MRISPVCFALLAAAASACGGKVILETSGGAGGSASTGVVSTSAVSTSAVSTSAVSTTATSTSSGAGGAGGCPVLAPNDGDPCDSPGLVCHVPVCCGGVATCTGDVWHVEADFCDHLCPAPCPGTNLTCDLGGVCVNNPIGGGPALPQPHYNCAFDPCMGAPLSCSCAASLCVVGPCAEASGSVVTCTSLAD
jgi:hypothetical protein